MVRERNLAQKLPIIVFVERRPAAIGRLHVQHPSHARAFTARARRDPNRPGEPAAPSPYRRYPDSNSLVNSKDQPDGSVLGRFIDQSPLRRTSFVSSHFPARSRDSWGGSAALASA